MNKKNPKKENGLFDRIRDDNHEYQVISYSIPEDFNAAISRHIGDLVRSGEFKNKSDFLRKVMTQFIGHFESILTSFPNILRKNDRKTLCDTVNISASMEPKMINTINDLVHECTIINSRSELIRFAFLFYYSDKLRCKKRDYGPINHVKMGGKIIPILDLDHVETADKSIMFKKYERYNDL